MAGLPGGIGNTGGECRGLTAPLVFLGLRHAREPISDATACDRPDGEARRPRIPGVFPLVPVFLISARAAVTAHAHAAAPWPQTAEGHDRDADGKRDQWNDPPEAEEEWCAHTDLLFLIV